MLFDFDIDSNFDSSWTPQDGGKAVAFIIDENVVHTMVIKSNFFNFLLNFHSSNDIEDRIVIDLLNSTVGEPSSIENNYIINFIKNNEIIESISTQQEILNAILLSDPKIIVLRPEIKKIGVEPGWKYIDGMFYND